MYRQLIALFLAGFFLALSPAAEALQCVPYARQQSGLQIKGNAWTWWSSAAGKYDRGNQPKVGAVLVFKRSGGMRYGHVSVVSKVVSPRKILVNHANWAAAGRGGRGKITRNAEVIDVSAKNDWSSVRVWYAAAHTMGRKNYPTYGFIYPSAPTKAPNAYLVADARPLVKSDPWAEAADQQVLASIEDVDSIMPAAGQRASAKGVRAGWQPSVTRERAKKAPVAQPKEQAVASSAKRKKPVIVAKKKAPKPAVVAKKGMTRPGDMTVGEAYSAWREHLAQASTKKKPVVAKAPVKKKPVKSASARVAKRVKK